MSKHAALNATLIIVANTLLILAGVFMILVAAGTSFTSSMLSYTLPAWPSTSDNTVTKTQNTIIQYSFYAFGGILIASGLSAIVFLQRWWRRLDYTPVLFLFHATLCGLAELVALAALVFAILATVMASRNANVTDTPAVVSGGTANATSRWGYLCIASGVVFLVNSVAFFGAVAEHRAKIRQRRDLFVTEINASSPPEHTSGLADAKWMARMSESHSAKMYLDDNAGAARRKPSGAGAGGGGAVAGIALTAPSLSASSSVTPYGPSGGGAGGGSARSNHYYGQDRNSLYAYPGPHQLYQQHQQQQSYSHQSAPYGYPLATAAAAAATSAAVVAGSGRGGRSNSAYYYPSGSTNDPYIQQPSIQPRVQQPDWDYSAHYTEELYPDYYHQSYQAQTYPAPQQQQQQQTLPPPPPPSAQLDRRETRNLYSPLPFVEPALGATTTTKSGGASTYEYGPPPSPTVDEYGIRSSSHHHHHHSHPNAMRLDGDDDADTHVDGLSPAPPRRQRGARQQLASSSSSYDLSRDSEAETRHDEEEGEEYEDDVDDRSDVFGVRGRDILPPRADGGGVSGVSSNSRQDRRNSDDFDDTRTNLTTTTTTTTTARQQREYEDTSSSVAGYAGSFYNSRRAGWVGASASGVGSDVIGGGGAAPHVLLAGHDQRARDSNNVRYI
ncbi:hypothetical protein BDZ88DRAFT_423081 [Geranomyces variabilis]|nr:hypothetical protein BDZ88DRAFT_423081 [Geranomyces variabilis]KAJ3131763.1 hypothetical protein HDU90_007747 [Geranomyces variabilis]